MSRPLRVLIVEDVEDDAALLRLELTRGGFEVAATRVDSAAGMQQALEANAFDVVVSDYHMPTFDALKALELAHSWDPDIPFIVVSGTIGEGAAVEAMKAGAHDFMTKGSLFRLNAAIDRELREATVRRERRALEDSLRSARQRLEEVIEAVPDVLWSVSVDGEKASKVTFVSPSCRNTFGREPGELADRPNLWHDVVEPADRAHVRSAFEQAIERCAPTLAIYCIRHTSGEIRWIEDAMFPVTDARGGVVAVRGIARDITDRRRLEEQLFISERMASVGTLAAGVAHEINNPLAALIANVEFAVQDLGRLRADIVEEGARARAGGADVGWTRRLMLRLPELEETLQDARLSASRVRSIVRDLKVFSRAGDEEKHGPVDVHQVLESSLRMAWNEIRHRATLVKDFADIPPVHGNEARLGQVFLNLLVNAAQAIPEGRAEKNEIRLVTRRTSTNVIVRISDTGTGMTPDVRARIFEPFFTTKPAGVGTGLGLAICRRIIASLGGQITVESEPGRGTNVDITMPISLRAIVADQEPDGPRNDDRHGRVLVIDDEPLVAAAVRRMLVPDHDVVVAHGAQDALDRILRGEDYDVILCDLMMPQITGMDVHAELQARAPDQARKIVFMTGGAFTASARTFLDDVENGRLEKPFDLGQLRAAVHRVLD
jgi:PAS domain S-box-containing protein